MKMRALLLATAILGSPAAEARASFDTERQCAALADAVPGARIRTVWHEASGETPPDPLSQFYDPIAPLPAHCEVVGTMNPRKGMDGQDYAVNFRMRLPGAWNGRFFFQGGAGSNGVVGNAIGYLQGRQTAHALGRGYAVLTNDGGHDMVANARADRGGLSAFGWDPQARLDYAGAQLPVLTQTAKDLIARYYGRRPERSYFVGCSKGGHEGLVVAEQLPSEFDGVLANAPAMNIPGSVYTVAEETRRFAALARAGGHVSPAGEPYLGRTFSDADLGLVSGAILNACDALDGLSDGIVANAPACTTARVRHALGALVCKGQKAETCLSSAQVKLLIANQRAGMGGSAWTWDAGIGGRTASGGWFQGWRGWKIGSDKDLNDGANATLVGPVAASLLSVPPVPLADTPAAAIAFLETVNLKDRTRFGAHASGNGFVAAANYLVANRYTLDAFRARGGKLISVHGASDPIFPLNDTIAWWMRVNRAARGKAADNVRVFPAPGMNHCTGGPATDRFDAFTALVDWVEQEKAPDRILAEARPSAPWPGRTRPLCPYPKQSRYTGTGSIEDAANFICR